MGIGSISGGSQPIGETSDAVIDSAATSLETATATATATVDTSASCFAPATGPSVTVEYGGVDYVCKNGKVFVGDAEIGTVTDAGDYAVTLNGPDGTAHSYSGNVGQLIGASVHGALSDGTDVDIDQVGETASTPTMISCAGPEKQLVQGRELKPNEGIDLFGNLVLWRTDPQTGLRNGSYMVLEHAPANVGDGGSTVVSQVFNPFYPEQSYREFSNGTRVPWDGKIPELAKRAGSTENDEADGPAPAPKEIVEALKNEYLAATGVPLNQAQLEMVGYTQALRNPEYLEVLKKQGEAVNAAYDKALGRAPTTAEKLYWVNLSVDLDMMKRGLDSLNNPVKTSKQYLENIGASLGKGPSVLTSALAPAGDLPAVATKAGLSGVESERLLAKERTPLVNPSFVKTPADAAAFERLRAASKLRGIDITDNPSSASWAQQMLESGTAKNPAFFKAVDNTIAAVRAAYQKQLNRSPTQVELAEWVPFSANMQYNERRAAQVLVELQDRQYIDAVTAKIQRR